MSTLCTEPCNVIRGLFNFPFASKKLHLPGKHLEILILLYIIYLIHFAKVETFVGRTTDVKQRLWYIGAEITENARRRRVILQPVIISFAKWKLHLHFLTTTACNFVTIALFILACAKRSDVDRPHEYSYKQLNCARRKICTLHKLYGAVAVSRSPLPTDKIFSFDMETRYYHNVVARFDSVSCFN